MKVVLLNPPSEEGYIRTGRWTRRSRGKQSWPPIHLAYATALLEREGFECSLIDASTEGLSYADVRTLISKIEPKKVVYYYGYDTFEEDLRFAELLKTLYDVILVGPWGHCIPDLLERTKKIDVVTYGEFEHTTLELVKGIPYGDVLGIKYKDKKGIHVNPPRSLCSSKELDAIPFVTDVYRRHLNLRNYRQTSLRFPFVDLFGTRSCPYACTFCIFINSFQGLQPDRYRERSIDNIIEELWFVKNEMPEVKQIWFQDDTMLPLRFRTLSQRIIDENLGITWGGYSRAEQTYETLKLAKDSGLRTLHVGYETGDSKTLKMINKGVTVEQMEEFAKHVKDLNLWTCAGFMIFPWQSKETVRETIQWAKHKIRPRRFSFTQLFPYPNTPVCETIENIKTPLLTTEEMTDLEREGFIEFYLKNLPWMFDTLKFPREWKTVLGDALGLIPFLLKRD